MCFFVDNLASKNFKIVQMRLGKTFHKFNFATISNKKRLGTIHWLSDLFFSITSIATTDLGSTGSPLMGRSTTTIGLQFEI